jgi:pilus assembly protein CpaE
MPELSVLILTTDEDQRTLLPVQVDGTAIAKTVNTIFGFPVGTTDPVVRRIKESHADVVLVDIPARDSASALRAIELLHSVMPQTTIFAIGDMSQPQMIVNAMRAGAREYLERPTSTHNLLEAMARLTSAQRKAHANSSRGKVFTVINAKGGNGATTIAINTALALQALHGNVALIDVAPLGHAALHLNLKPAFTVMDAIHNLHRLDGTLLEGYMGKHERGLHLLAGVTEPTTQEASSAEFARLFDLLVTQYGHVVVDASSRLDVVTRVLCDLSDQVLLVAQADVTSLWSAVKVQGFLGDHDRIRLVLNRFRKIPGFSEADVESATQAKLLWKVPNQYALIAQGIDRGSPVTEQNHSEIARSFVGLASALTPREAEETTKRTMWSLFRSA